MNEKTTYETTIADKLARRKVPDLKDAIWSRINDQLNLDMPDGNDTPPQPPKPRKPFRLRAGKKAGILAAVVAVVILTIFITKQPVNKSIEKTEASSQQTRMPVSDAVKDDPPDAQLPATVPQQKSATIPNALPDTGSSVFNIPAFPIVIPQQQPARDSIFMNVLPPVASKQVPDTSIPLKKPKGFKGITNDDYKISLKKDSVP